MLISKHSQKRFQHANQMINFLSQINIENINQVDFPINVLVLRKKTSSISQKFIEMLEVDIKTIHKKFDFSKKMIPLTKKEQSEYENAKNLLDLPKRI